MPRQPPLKTSSWQARGRRTFQENRTPKADAEKEARSIFQLDPSASFDPRPLIRQIDGKLTQLLRHLNPEQWMAPTVCREWVVRDIAAHLLDGNLRRIAVERDGHYLAAEEPIEGYRDLVQYLNKLNAQWVVASRRLSPGLLTDLLEISSGWLHDSLESLDLQDEAIFPVSWAGQSASPVWFDLAREYTEKWHHQQQIREAADEATNELTVTKYLRPVFNTFMIALPHHYRDLEAESGTCLRVDIEGDAGGTWFLIRESKQWRTADDSSPVKNRVRLPQDTAWRLFTKGLAPDEAREELRFEGEERLANRLLELLAVMA